MKTISQREFRNNSASVMDAVEAGETYLVTRNGVEIAELRPLSRRRRLTAELHQGVVMARDAVTRAVRTEQLGAAIVDFLPLPFGGEAAARYGSLVALTLAAGRSPKPRRMGLMIAAIASSRSLPLYTRNAADFVGLDSLVDVVEV